MALQDNTLGVYLERAGISLVVSDEERMRIFSKVGNFRYEHDAATSECLGIDVFRIIH